MSLTLRAIAKRYRRKTVLTDVDVDFGPGLNLLVGPSGAGKSTLLRLVATAEKPTRGTLAWDGTALPAARRALRATLGYAPQSVELPDELTAREFGAHMSALKGLDGGARAQFEAIADALGLHADIDRPIGAFSGGMRRRLVTAQALLGAPRLLALDEPTAELDPDSAARVNALVLDRAAKGAVVVMTTHLAEALAPSAAAVLRVEEGAVARVGGAG